MLKYLVILPDLASWDFSFLSKAKEQFASTIAAAATILKMLEGVSITTFIQNFATVKRRIFEWCCFK